MSMQKTHFFRLLPLVLGLVCLQISAQDNSSPAADGPVIPDDESDHETAAEYLDLRNLRGEAKQLTGAQLARRFDVVVQRATWVDIDDLVDDPAGRSNDNLPKYRDSIGVVLNEGKEIRLLLQKVPRGDGVSVWKISNATVSLIPKLYKTYGYPEAVETLRRSLPNVSFLGFELFKWVIVLAVGLLAYVTVFLIAIVIRRMLGDPNTPSHRQVFRFLAIPAGIWTVVMSMHAVAAKLGRSVDAEAWQSVSPIPLLVTVWFIYAGINLLRDIYSTRLQGKGRPGALVLLRPAGQVVKILIIIIAVLIYLDKLGVNITTVLAGLGVGGIAVALALQKPLEDVLGAMTLLTTQPVRVGDFCRIGDQTGTIEEISLRTTRIRTLANTLISIPNARLVTQPIDNISAREKIWYRPILRLRYDTTPEQLRHILEGIRELLSSHERVLRENNRVRFMKIAEDALLIEVYGYLATTDWAEYLEVAEELNIRILEIIAQAGTSLSPPARTLHIEQSAPTGKTEAA